MTIEHASGLPDPAVKIRQTRPSATCRSADLGEGVAEVVGERVFGGEDLAASAINGRSGLCAMTPPKSKEPAQPPVLETVL
jgi:hypothetical protein